MLMMKNEFKAIGFDLNGVVVGNAIPHMLDYVKTKLDVPAVKLKDCFTKYSPALDRGDITDREFWEMVNRDLGIKADIELEEEYRIGHYLKDAPLRKRVLELADRLRAAGYKVGLLSNIEAEELALNRTRHIFEHFDAVVFSNEIAAVKPDVAAYEELIKRLGLQKPEELIFIDDLIENVVGAQKLGIYGIKFAGYSVLKQELEELGIRI